MALASTKPSLTEDEVRFFPAKQLLLIFQSTSRVTKSYTKKKIRYNLLHKQIYATYAGDKVFAEVKIDVAFFCSKHYTLTEYMICYFPSP